MQRTISIARLLSIGLTVAIAVTAQVSILQIQVVEGEGIVHPSGTRSTHPIAVLVTDDAGRPVAGAAVSFHLPDDGPGGVFVNGLRTDVAVTDAQGRAAVRAFQANRSSGQFQIRIVASKEQARAGVVSFQYVGPERAGAKAAPGRSTWKWLAIVAAGGGAAAAVAASHRGGAAAAPTAPLPVPAPAGITIGPPSISIGKP